MSIPAYTPATAVMEEELLTSGLLTRRVFAWFVDLFLLGILFKTFWLMMAAFTVLTFGFGAPLFALLAFLPTLYGFISLMTPMQASPGQALFGLIVVRDADLGPPTPLQALVYIIGYTITMMLGVIWTFVAVLSSRHRTLHDMLSGLLVVRRSALRIKLTGGAPRWNMGPGGSPSTPPGGGRPYA